MAAAAIVVVVIVVFAALYFVFVPARPTVQFGAPTGLHDRFVVYVTSASRAEPASSYRVNLVVDGASGTTAPVALATNVTVAGLSYFASWGDLDHDGRVTKGDGFGVMIEGVGSLGPVPHVLQLLWSDGSVVSSVTYTPTTPLFPVVVLTAPTTVTDGFQVQVAAVSYAAPGSEFHGALVMGYNMSTQATLAASMTFSEGPYTYAGTWVDVGGEGSLTAGDTIRITRVGSFPPSPSFTFHVFWRDGTSLAHVDYP